MPENTPRRLRRAGARVAHLAPTLTLAVLTTAAFNEAAAAPSCKRTLTADVVALDQPFFYNRYGAANPAGMMYALRRDVVDMSSGKTAAEGAGLEPGKVSLRPDKRPRPLALRMNVGDCLTIHFQNLLAPSRVDQEQPVTRNASIHAIGLDYVNGIGDDGGNVGANPSSLVAPGGTATYTFHASREGAHLFYSGGAMVGGEGDGGTIAFGLFGAINVEAPGAEWYRSQVTAADLALATDGDFDTGHPKIR
jgi:hypothetical protein